MSVIRHGLSIGIERVNNEFFLSLKAVGKLTHEDYKKITPMRSKRNIKELHKKIVYFCILHC